MNNYDELMLKSRLHIMDAFLTLFSLTKGG